MAASHCLSFTLVFTVPAFERYEIEEYLTLCVIYMSCYMFASYYLILLIEQLLMHVFKCNATEHKGFHEDPMDGRVFSVVFILIYVYFGSRIVTETFEKRCIYLHAFDY